MPDLPNEVLADLTEDDWQAINRIGEELADETKDQAQDQQDVTEDSTEEKETSQTEEETAEPYMQFNSKKELQNFIDERLNGRIERERRKASEDKEKAEAEARRKALEDQEKFKELYEAEKESREKAEARVEELSTYEEKVGTYRDTVSNLASQRMDELQIPKGVRRMLEDRYDEQERLDWLSDPENVEGFGAATESIDPSPNGDETPTPEADEKARADFAQLEASKF